MVLSSVLHDRVAFIAKKSNLFLFACIFGKMGATDHKLERLNFMHNANPGSKNLFRVVCNL